MTITLRTTKGSQLTYQEADDNWREILDLRRMTIDQVTSGGTANALTANFTRAVVLQNGVTIKVKISQANTAASPTLNVNSTGAKVISTLDGSPLGVGGLIAGSVIIFSYDSGIDKWVALTGGDALTFGGKSPSFYLNYDNFNAGGPIDEAYLPEATTTDKGIIRIATEAEASAGTVDDAALTPATLSAGIAGIGSISETVLFTSSVGVTAGTVNLSESSEPFDAIALLLSGQGNPTGLEPVIVTREMINQTATLASGEFSIAIGRGSTGNSCLGVKINTNNVFLFSSDGDGRLHSVIGINY